MAERTGLMLESDVDETIDGAAENEFAAESAGEETPDDAAQIREQIEETRQEMSETIQAIEEKLSFSNISEQVRDQVSEHLGSAIEAAKDTVYNATFKKAENFMKNAGRELKNTKIFDGIQENPVTFVLIGAGVAALTYALLGDGSKGRGKKNPQRFRSENESKPSSLKTAQKKIGEVYGDVSDAAANVYEGAGDIASRSYEKAGVYGSQARDVYDHQIEENPLAVGAVALAVGAAIGFLIPSTNYENELMGETRQNLVQKVRDSAGELVGQVKSVAADAGKTLTEEVKNQGFSL